MFAIKILSLSWLCISKFKPDYFSTSVLIWVIAIGGFLEATLKHAFSRSYKDRGARKYRVK